MDKKTKELQQKLDSLGIKNYKINADLTVDVAGDVDLSGKGLIEIPLKFGVVTGSFYCNSNKLTSLEGAPKEVGEEFYCDNNKLTSLEGAPKKVGRDFYCGFNKLTSLAGAPEKIGGDFYYSNNPGNFTKEAIDKAINIASVKETDIARPGR